MTTEQHAEKRVMFDFEIEFANGGGIQGQEFRLDIEGDTIGDRELGAYLVRDLRLLMASTVRILNKRIITEPHQRSAEVVTGSMRASRHFVDLSHTVEDGLITYRGLPAPVICDYLSREQSRTQYAQGTEFQIGKIEMVANTGTYLDSPFHRFATGQDLAELDLRSLADLDAIVVRVLGMNERAIPGAAFGAFDVGGKAVLVHTGWDRHWRADQYFDGHPFLTEDAALYLRDAGAALVGIDSLNIDDTADGRRPVHTTLLGAGIPIVEHLCRLDRVPTAGSRFSAVPVKVKGMGTFPVRAYAVLGA